MKKQHTLITTLFFLMFCIACSTKQKEKEVFKTDIQAYLQAFNNKQWDSVTAMLYPKLFDFTNKENITQSFQTLNKMGMDMQIQLENIKAISDILEYKQEEFCKIDYFGKLSIQLKGELEKNAHLLQEGFCNVYGKDNVHFNSHNNTYHIDAHKSMIAIRNKGSKKWTYLEYNSEQTELTNKLIPSNISAQFQKPPLHPNTAKAK